MHSSIPAKNSLYSMPIIQWLGNILWPTFVLAGVASGFFFSTFDPVKLSQQATFPTSISPLAGYTLGFLGFWLFGIACSSSTFFLINGLPGKLKSNTDRDPSN